MEAERQVYLNSALDRDESYGRFTPVYPLAEWSSETVRTM
jgi:hypothetical protein